MKSSKFGDPKIESIYHSSEWIETVNRRYKPVSLWWHVWWICSKLGSLEIGELFILDGNHYKVAFFVGKKHQLSWVWPKKTPPLGGNFTKQKATFCFSGSSGRLRNYKKWKMYVGVGYARVPQIRQLQAAPGSPDDGRLYTGSLHGIFPLKVPTMNGCRYCK